MDNFTEEQMRLIVKAIHHYQAHNLSLSSDRYKEYSRILNKLYIAC